MRCKAVQHSDEMYCAACGLRWDVNDPCPPDCRNATNVTLIGLTGAAGSGKSTLAQYMHNQHGYHRVRFASILKNMIRTMLRGAGVSDAEIEAMIEGDLKEVPHAALGGKTPRHAMQTLGTEWGRNLIDENLWTNLTGMYLDSLYPSVRVVIEDVRFENEATMIRQRGGKIVRMDGRGGIPGTHQSESGVEPDLSCYNGGSLTQTQRWFDYVFTMR